MKIVTFCDVDDSAIDSKHTVEHFQSGSSGDAQVAIIDIDTIFDFEENKHDANIPTRQLWLLCLL